MEWEFGILFALLACLCLVYRNARAMLQQGEGWRDRQEELLGSLEPAAEAGQPFTVPADPPNPLEARQELLARLRDTPLMEGDLGGLLLRRPEIPGQHAGVTGSQALVSWALIFTVLGLFVTMLFLAEAVEGVGGEALGDLVARVSRPLGRIPLVFLPTAFGLGLATLLTRLQARFDAELEEVWERLDRFTLRHLLPAALAARKSQEPIQELREAVALLSPTLKGMQASFEQVGRAVEGLRGLDQSRWVETVERAVGSMEQRFRASAERLEGVFGQTRAVTEALGGAVTSLTPLIQAVKESGGQLQDQLQVLAEVQVRAREGEARLVEAAASLGGLKEELAAMQSNLNSLNQNFGSWGERQTQGFQALTGLVGKLHEAVDPMHQSWQAASSRMEQQGQAVQGGLREMVEGLSQVRQGLQELLTAQREALAALGPQLVDQLREGHEAFLDSVSSQLDPDLGTFQQLGALNARLEALSGGLAPLHDDLQGSREGLGELRGALEAYVAQLGGLLDGLQVGGGREELARLVEVAEGVSRDLDGIAQVTGGRLWTRARSWLRGRRR